MDEIAVGRQPGQAVLHADLCEHRIDGSHLDLDPVTLAPIEQFGLDCKVRCQGVNTHTLNHTQVGRDRDLWPRVRVNGRLPGNRGLSAGGPADGAISRLNERLRSHGGAVEEPAEAEMAELGAAAVAG